MKKITIVVLSLISSLYLVSCGKYEEGPALSLRTKTARVANTWKIEKVIKNGADATISYGDFVANFTMVFERDGSYTESLSQTNGTKNVSEGTWKFSDDSKEIINTINGQGVEVYTILKLKNSEFWYTTFNGVNKTEIHLIPKED